MASYADDRIGRTIYADDLKLVKRRVRKTASGSTEKASLQLMKIDNTELYKRLDEMGEDNIISPVEKKSLQREWSSLKSSKAATLQKVEEYGIQYQTVYNNYASAYDSLSVLMDFILDPLNSEENTDISDIGDLTASYQYYYERAILLDEELFKFETGLLDGLDDRIKMALRLNSSLGNTIPLDGTPTLLTATLLKENEDISSMYDDMDFLWERISTDRAADLVWNDSHDLNRKNISITVADLMNRTAMFYCKFDVLYSATMRLTQSNFISINEEIPGPAGEDAYQLQVVSQSGTVFRMGQSFSTVLEVRVWQGGEEITGYFNDADFLWTRKSNDLHSDEIWNSQHFSSGGKTLTISQADVVGRCVFNCDLLRERS